MKFNLKKKDVIFSDILIPFLSQCEIEFFGKPISSHEIEFIRIYESDFTMEEISNEYDVNHPEETFYTDSMKLFRTKLAHIVTKELVTEARKLI